MTDFTTYYRLDHGRRRLLEQPHDVQPRDPARSGRGLAGAGPQMRRIFDNYRGDLRTVLGVAAPWWEGTIAAQEGLGLSRAEAVRVSFDRRAAGAASYPQVVWIVRTYWLRCVDVGARYPEQHVYPEEFMLLWLEEAGEEDLVRLIACMPYWPIGLDADGNWC